MAERDTRSNRGNHCNRPGRKARRHFQDYRVEEAISSKRKSICPACGVSVYACNLVLDVCWRCHERRRLGLPLMDRSTAAATETARNVLAFEHQAAVNHVALPGAPEVAPGQDPGSHRSRWGSRPCTCGGVNENCSKCDGRGVLPDNVPTQAGAVARVPDGSYGAPRKYPLRRQ